MRSRFGVPWVVVAGLAWAALGCGTDDASGSDSGKSNQQEKPPWLTGGQESSFPTEEADDTNGTKNLGNAGGAGGTPEPGSGGGGGTVANPVGLSTLCQGYDPTQFSHTLTASARDPGNLASATRARELLQSGKTPVPGAVRGADFVNYYAKTSANVANGALGGTVELRTRKINGVDIPTQLELYVGIEAGPVTRPQVALTVLVDATLSPEGLARAKATVAGLAGGLQAGDHLTLMSADPAAQVLEMDLTTDFANEVATWAETLTTGAGTVAARLPDAYAKAKTLPSGAWNRIIVIGDGEESPDAPDYALIDSEAANSKIFLTAVGVSPESDYGDVLLYRLSHQGRGRYLYIDDVSEPGALFSTRFTEIFGIARDKVRIRVDLPDSMRALDPEPAGGGGGAPRDKYLAPGESARFVFHLSICNKAVYADPTFGLEQVSVTVDSVMPNGGPATPFSVTSLPVKKSSYTATPELDKMTALQSFVDALKYPEKSRFDEAKTRLGALTASPGPELLTLLAQHPSFPSQ